MDVVRSTLDAVLDCLRHLSIESVAGGGQSLRCDVPTTNDIPSCRTCKCPYHSLMKMIQNQLQDRSDWSRANANENIAHSERTSCLCRLYNMCTSHSPWDLQCLQLRARLLRQRCGVKYQINTSVYVGHNQTTSKQT